MSRRRRSWTPPADHQAVIPSLGDGATRWAPWPDHVATARPACSSCAKPAMEWNRCPCGAVFALCSDHGRTGDAWKARDEHIRSCKAREVDRPRAELQP